MFSVFTCGQFIPTSPFHLNIFNINYLINYKIYKLTYFVYYFFHYIFIQHWTIHATTAVLPIGRDCEISSAIAVKEVEYNESVYYTPRTRTKFIGGKSVKCVKRMKKDEEFNEDLLLDTSLL